MVLCISIYSFKFLSSITLYGYTTIYLYIHLFTKSWVVFCFWLLLIKLHKSYNTYSMKAKNEQQKGKENQLHQGKGELGDLDVDLDKGR